MRRLALAIIIKSRNLLRRDAKFTETHHVGDLLTHSDYAVALGLQLRGKALQLQTCCTAIFWRCINIVKHSHNFSTLSSVTITVSRFDLFASLHVLAMGPSVSQLADLHRRCRCDGDSAQPFQGKSVLCIATISNDCLKLPKSRDTKGLQFSEISVKIHTYVHGRNRLTTDKRCHHSFKRSD